VFPTALGTEALIWILAAGAATGVGGLWLLLVPRPSELLLDCCSALMLALDNAFGT
jgi:hypothetical protein